MRSETVKILTKAGTCDAFQAYPDSGGPFPAVILLMDAFGLRPYLESMAQRLAEQGFFVLVPNLFYRVHASPVYSFPFPLTSETIIEARKELAPIYQLYQPEMGVEDSEFFLKYLADQKAAATAKIGLCGYCMGGGLALRIAAKFPEQVAAAASFHGGNLASEAPHSPHLLIPKIRASLYFAHADQDPLMPASQIELLEKTLKNSALRYETEIYSAAKHGFTMLDLPAGDESALKRHWEKLLALLARELK